MLAGLVMAAALVAAPTSSAARDVRAGDVAATADLVARFLAQKLPVANTVLVLAPADRNSRDRAFAERLSTSLRSSGFAVAESHQAVRGASTVVYRASSDAQGALVLLDVDGVSLVTATEWTGRGAGQRKFGAEQ